MTLFFRREDYRFEEGVRVKDGTPVRVLIGSRETKINTAEDQGLFRRFSEMGKLLVEGSG